MKVLACGGRNYADARRVDEALFLVAFEDGPISLLIEGGAPGADTLAREWALRQRIHYATVPALWDGFGRSAGPLRNAAMLLLQPDSVVAFPGSAGTADMVRRAREAGIPVREIA